MLDISIHALREEGDFTVSNSFSPVSIFLSTPSARRATAKLDFCSAAVADFYPRPPRGGRPTRPEAGTPEKEFLSTPSARRATICLMPSSGANGYFYPRPPRGGRLMEPERPVREPAFLSTPSARRATALSRFWTTRSRYFYPRPPRGGRRHGPPQDAAGRVISIHALREEGDLSASTMCNPCSQFLSTPSARRATED